MEFRNNESRQPKRNQPLEGLEDMGRNCILQKYLQCDEVFDLLLLAMDRGRSFEKNTGGFGRKLVAN